ncbi:MAG: hypothetical protein AAGA55_02060 [Planctomycetota bacterium]
MTDMLPRSSLLRLGIVCVGLIVLWSSTVRPARAAFESRQATLSLQREEIVAYAQSGSDLAGLQSAAAVIGETAERLDTLLGRHTSAKQALSEIERIASTNSIRVSRTEPLVPTRVSVPQHDSSEPILLVADRFSIRMAGTYADVIRFMVELQCGLGIVRVDAMRLSPAGEDNVNVSVEVSVFRFDPKSPGLIEHKEGAGHAG